MSQLRNDPIRVVPKRALLLALLVSVIIIGITILFSWPTLLTLAGFWVGVVINLVNFRLIVIGSKNLLEKKEAGLNASILPNYFLRITLYALVLIVAWRIAIPAMLGAFIGMTMVSTAIKLDGFFVAGYKNTEESPGKEISEEESPAKEHSKEIL